MDLNLIWKVCLIVGSLCAAMGASLILKLKPDNAIEEVAEEVIKQETGIEIDLSPDSPED